MKRAVVLSISLLCSYSILAQTRPATPILTVTLPEDIAAIQARSPGTRIVQTFGGNVGVTFWEVTTPAFLKGGDQACAFDLDLSKVPKHAAFLTGTQGTIADEFQVDTFGNMARASALDAAFELRRRLQRSGWKFTDMIQPSYAEASRALRTDTGGLVAELQCLQSVIMIATDRDPRNPRLITYKFVYSTAARVAPRQ